jgi:hypothetical protein
METFHRALLATLGLQLGAYVSDDANAQMKIWAGGRDDWLGAASVDHVQPAKPRPFANNDEGPASLTPVGSSVGSWESCSCLLAIIDQIR